MKARFSRCASGAPVQGLDRATLVVGTVVAVDALDRLGRGGEVAGHVPEFATFLECPGDGGVLQSVGGDIREIDAESLGSSELRSQLGSVFETLPDVSPTLLP